MKWNALEMRLASYNVLLAAQGTTIVITSLTLESSALVSLACEPSLLSVSYGAHAADNEVISVIIIITNN